MSEFLPAFNATMKTEYGYNPGKGEAETINGVDRSQHPTLPLWKVVDQIKAANPKATVPQLNKLFDANKQLQTDIQAFYLAEFWNPMGLSAITDQQVANGLYDGAVNPCIITVDKAAQIAINSLKNKMVVADGQFGPKCIAAVNSLPPALMLTAFNGVRQANYNERVRLTPSKAEWLPSWQGRCKPYIL